MFTKRVVTSSVALLLVAGLAGCSSPARYGMVADRSSGVQIGSAVERNIFVDATQFKNRTVKLTIRNASGDQAYQVGGIASEINAALTQKGYSPTNSDQFGLRFDVNVLYSGQVQSNLASTYAFLGGAAGGIAGYRSSSQAATASGMLVGATLGSIIGSNVTDDTYILIAEVSIGVNNSSASDGGDTKSITFGSSPKLQLEPSASNFVPFREELRSKVAVFAGGRNIDQRQVADQVRQRLSAVVSNIL